MRASNFASNRNALKVARHFAPSEGGIRLRPRESIDAAEEVERRKDEEARKKAFKQAQEELREEEAAREVQREAER
eukprot:16437328-Heterocapsa_arctica.AAC.1